MSALRDACAAVAACMALAVVTTSCATTIVETDATTTSTSTTTTTLPSGDVDVLLETLLDRVRGLSEIVVETGGERAQNRLAEIEAVWERSRVILVRDHATLIEDFDRMIALCRLAVERRRPAEADKAYAFLRPLVAAVARTA
jgi:hypothetical protein